ncbi:MAG: hypothetical protein ACRC1Z_13475 [Waterburya sp.]
MIEDGVDSKKYLNNFFTTKIKIPIQQNNMKKTPLTEAETSNYDQTKNSIYLIEGESFFTRCLVDYFIARGWNSQFILAEADPNIDDVRRAYPNLHHDDCEKVYFSDSKFRWDEASPIVNRAEAEKTVVANLPSNTRLQLNLWLDSLGFLSSTDWNDDFNRIVYFFVSDGSYYSIEQFFKQLDKYPMDKLYQCLVLNPGRLSLEHLEEHKPLMEAIKTHQFPVLTFPKLDSSLQFECEKENLSYQKLDIGKSISIQQKVSRFSHQIELLYGEIFPSVINDPQGLMEIAEAQKNHSILKKAFFGKKTTVLL